MLDGKAVKTPLKQTLYAPNEDVAHVLMKEWAEVEEQIDPNTMPCTQILSTCTDRIRNERAALQEQVLKYLDTDLVCYRTPPSTPEEEQQASTQAELWDPWCTWFEEKFGKPLQTTTDIAALTQDELAHKNVKTAVEALDDLRFTLLQMIVPLSGSLVLALAFVDGKIEPQALYDMTHIEERFKDEMYKAEKYGRDPMQEKVEREMMRDLNAAKQILDTL